MKVKLISRPRKDLTQDSPQSACIQYASENGFELRREPFGQRGSLIEVYWAGEETMIGYRKSYSAALSLMKSLKENSETNKETR